MSNMRNLKSTVFTLAHAIKSFFVTWSEALKAAWILAKLKFNREIIIKFVKVSTGEIRTAKPIGVGSLDTVKKGFVRFIEVKDGKEQWRSFKLKMLVLS